MKKVKDFTGYVLIVEMADYSRQTFEFKTREEAFRKMDTLKEDREFKWREWTVKSRRTGKEI